MIRILIATDIDLVPHYRPGAAITKDILNPNTLRVAMFSEIVAILLNHHYYVIKSRDKRLPNTKLTKDQFIEFMREYFS